MVVARFFLFSLEPKLPVVELLDALLFFLLLQARHAFVFKSVMLKSTSPDTNRIHLHTKHVAVFFLKLLLSVTNYPLPIGFLFWLFWRLRFLQVLVDLFLIEAIAEFIVAVFVPTAWHAKDAKAKNLRFVKCSTDFRIQVWIHFKHHVG